jgi:ribosomal protein S18 acetylase RimI-like enzyme
MNAEMTLRRGGLGDRAFVLELGRRTAIDSVSALRPTPLALVEASYERLVEFAFDASYVLLVAEDELDGPLGFCLMLDTLPDEVSGMPQGFVAYMAVDPNARRQGIARALLDAAEAAARERGLPHVALMVTEDNAPARELYAQAGYLTERRLLCKTL